MTQHRPNTLPVPEEGRCLNCNASLIGEYCAHCGQHVKHHVHSTVAVVGELVEDLFHTDHRVWRTIVPLLRRPGEVTVEYLRGKRMSYTPPFRLYIVLSLLFFLSVSLSHVDADNDADADAPVQADGKNTPALALTPEAEEKLAEFLERVEKEKRPEVRRRLEASLLKVPPSEQAQIVSSMSNPCSPQALGAALPENFAGKQRLMEVCKNVAADHGKQLVQRMREHVPQMMFFFLPLIALSGKVLYLGSRRYYAEHLLFFVHFHAFFFLAATVNNVLGWLLGWFKGGWASTIAGLLTTVLVIYIPVYLYKAMRRVYGQGRLVTAIKFTLLIGAYASSVFLTFAVLAAYTAMTLK